MILAIIMLIFVLFCGTSVQPHSEYEIDAEIILADEVPIRLFLKPEINIEEPNQLCNLERLQIFLSDDATNQHEYIELGESMYNCVNFATDLSQNLTDECFDSGIVVKSAKYHDIGCGHILTWVRIDDDLFVVESINDDIYWSDDFNASVDCENYVVRYESLSSGYRKVNEMFKRFG